MKDSAYKALQRAHPHSHTCRFTKPCHFRMKLRNKRTGLSTSLCTCLSDCGFRSEYEDCPFRLTDEEFSQRVKNHPFDTKYAEVHSNG